MCFEKNNKNFIKIELHANMKGLTDEEKLINYEVIKDETRKRLKSAYTDCENLFSLYEEAFKYLPFYDFGFLLLNLFLEKDSGSIFLYLSNGSLEKSKINHKECFSPLLYNDIKNTFSNHLEINFLKLEFTKLLGLNSVDWESINTDRNAIVKKYACWLMDINKTNIQDDLNIYSYFLFCKIWNLYDSYQEHFSTKAIVFYNTLNERFEQFLNEGIYINLNRIISDLKAVKDSLFVDNIGYYPLLDENTEGCSGYNIQRGKFNEYRKLSSFLSKSYINESYDSIFKKILNTDSILSKKLNKEINKKLDRLHIPTQKELDIIMNINMEVEEQIFKKEFLRRLYIY